MKKLDYFFLLFFVSIVTLLILPFTRDFIGDSSSKYPYLMGFIKTSILASYGEMLASRLMTKNYFSKNKFIFRFIVWGFLGMAFVLVFKIFDQGIKASLAANLLPNVATGTFFDNIYIAFLTSFFMNIIFAPTFMILHRFTDTYLDLTKEKEKTNIKNIIETIDWNNFFSFVVFKTIPLFWIPAHTITFLLPENFRVLSAGFLSIALGLILSIAKIKKQKPLKNV
ncbi:MAG: hypothetical protein AB7E16_03430 [Candidatus Izemoplasmatales bacterium]